jgi:hypothetical protein
MSSDSYCVATDARVLRLQRQFEDLLNTVPAEFGPRQSIRFVKKNGAVIVEIISSFKFTVPTE